MDGWNFWWSADLLAPAERMLFLKERKRRRRSCSAGPRGGRFYAQNPSTWKWWETSQTSPLRTEGVELWGAWGTRTESETAFSTLLTFILPLLLLTLLHPLLFFRSVCSNSFHSFNRSSGETQNPSVRPDSISIRPLSRPQATLSRALSQFHLKWSLWRDLCWAEMSLIFRSDN